MVAQMPANSIQGPKRARSAIAPEMSATVMMANTAWKPTKARLGTVATRDFSLISPCRPK